MSMIQFKQALDQETVGVESRRMPGPVHETKQLSYFVIILIKTK